MTTREEVVEVSGAVPEAALMLIVIVDPRTAISVVWRLLLQRINSKRRDWVVWMVRFRVV